MAKEYIDREAVIRKLNNIARDLLKDNSIQCSLAAGTIVDIKDTVIAKQRAADVVEIPKSGIGDLSDGYHTFNELYHHRAILFSVICNSNPVKAWKSKLHDTGDMYDGMFIVGIETPQGQATYHYDINPYWDMFKVRELEKAPKWDGHTPKDAIERISVLKADVEEVRHGKWEYGKWEQGHWVKGNERCKCSVCRRDFAVDNLNIWYGCPHCLAKMDGKDGAENG